MMNQDGKHLDAAVSIAQRSLSQGNYPVGAVLVIDGSMVDVKGNTGQSNNNFINHAEMNVISANAELMRKQGYDNGLTIELFSTLEPCLMCLGAAVMNKVSRIVYIQTDPHGGACHIDTSSLGVRYREIWPEISQLQEYSDQPRKMILTYLHSQIDKGVNVEWSKKMLGLFP